jgi:energy-coupling factor transporter ATP-binding protein EcfA2
MTNPTFKFYRSDFVVQYSDKNTEISGVEVREMEAKAKRFEAHMGFDFTDFAFDSHGSGKMINFLDPGLSVVFGPRGSGKTTFLNGVVPSDQIVYFGEPDKRVKIFQIEHMIGALFAKLDKYSVVSVDSVKSALLMLENATARGGLSQEILVWFDQLGAVMSRDDNQRQILMVVNPHNTQAQTLEDWIDLLLGATNSLVLPMNKSGFLVNNRSSKDRNVWTAYSYTRTPGRYKSQEIAHQRVVDVAKSVTSTDLDRKDYVRVFNEVLKKGVSVGWVPKTETLSISGSANLADVLRSEFRDKRGTE